MRRAGIGLIEQLGRPLFDDARPDAAEDILGAALLEHDICDAMLAQQLTQQQSGRAGPDDDDLRPHQDFSCRVKPARADPSSAASPLVMILVGMDCT